MLKAKVFTQWAWPARVRHKTPSEARHTFIVLLCVSIEKNKERQLLCANEIAANETELLPILRRGIYEALAAPSDACDGCRVSAERHVAFSQHGVPHAYVVVFRSGYEVARRGSHVKRLPRQIRHPLLVTWAVAIGDNQCIDNMF